MTPDQHDQHDQHDDGAGGRGEPLGGASGVDVPAGGTGAMSETTVRVLVDVAGERRRQLQLWGRRGYPDGTGDPAWAREAAEQREYVEQAGADGELTWLALVREDVSRVFAEPDPAVLRVDLVHAAALLCAWVEHLDRQRAAHPSGDAGHHHPPASSTERTP